MDIISSAKRYVLQKSIASAYEASLMLMRKDPEATRKKLSESGKSIEGLEDIFSMPDFVVKRLAECTAELIVDDPRMNDILKGKAELESAKLTEKLGTKVDVVDWFNKTKSDHPQARVSEEQVKRDGAELLCRKAASYFERGLFSQAEKFFSRAVQIDENHADGWAGLADALEALKREEQADQARLRAKKLKSQSQSESA
jgi:tetratricopeptide (TPR) repeat protein